MSRIKGLSLSALHSAGEIPWELMTAATDEWAKAKSLSNLRGKHCLLDLTQAWESLCKKEAGCVSQPPELLHKNEPASQLALQCGFLCHLSSNHQMKWEPHGQTSPASPVSPFLQSSGYSARLELPFPSCFILKNRHNLDFYFMKLFAQVLPCCYFEQKCKVPPPHLQLCEE